MDFALDAGLYVNGSLIDDLRSFDENCDWS